MVKKIFSTAGKAIGGYFGGPVGAKIGGKIGGAVGGQVKGGKKKKKGVEVAAGPEPTGVDFSGLMSPVLGGEGGGRRGSDTEIAVAPVAGTPVNPAFALMQQWDQILKLPERED